MACKATMVSRKAARAAREAQRRSANARAAAALARAEEAVVRATTALEDARSAAEAVAKATGDPRRAGDAARAAERAVSAADDAARAAGAARSALIVAEAMGERDTRPREQAVEPRARYFVERDGVLLASFAREDDALLFEGELADLDVARGITNASCEVRDSRGRHRGGYLISGGRLVAFVADDVGEIREQRAARTLRA